MLFYTFIWPGTTEDDCNFKVESSPLTIVIIFKQAFLTFMTIMHAHEHENIDL